MTQLIRAARGFALAAAFGLPLTGAAFADSSFSGAYLAAQHAARAGDVDAAATYFQEALDRDPDDLRLMEQALLYQAAAGRMDEAMELSSRLNVFDAKNRVATLLLVAKDMKAGEYAALADRVEQAKQGIHPLVGEMFRGWAAFGQGDEPAAEAAFGALDERPVFRIFSLYHTALARHAGHEPERAIETYRELAAVLDAPPTGRVARAYAAALVDAGQADEARTVHEAAAALGVGDDTLEEEIAALADPAAGAPLVETPAEGAAEALFGLASAVSGDGDPRLSLLYARLATWLRPDFHESTLLVAEILAANDQQAAAIRAYESIPPGSRLIRAAEIGRAEALHRMGRDDEAVEALKAVTRRAPEAADPQIALGDLLRRTERFSEAAKAYDSAIKLMAADDRSSWALLYQRGISYERSNQWDKAEADFLAALEQEPDQPLVLNYLGYSWLEKGVNFDKAMEMIRKAVEQRPEDGYIVDSLGWGYYLLGDFDNAAAELERAVELQPVDPTINDHYGDALWRVGRRMEAEFQWKRALSFDPEDKIRDRIRRKLERGLDAVLAEEAAAKPAAAGASANDG
ncbi:MAG: tetratricopeptide repeat protein [Pikeienuella sp.]